jgi:sortase B
MVFSGVMLIREKLRAQKEIAEFDELAALIQSETTAPAEIESESESEAESLPETEPAPVFKRNLQPVFDQNPDCIGWICIENTTVDYPVMFTPDSPQKYLRKSFSGSYSISGTPFLNDNGGLDFNNLIIYGHNMKNGTMFSDIVGYIDPAYRDANPIIEFETAAGLKCYEVFAVLQVKSVDDWYGFTNADSAEMFDSLVADIKGRALYETGITPSFDQQILTLSTCHGPKNDDRLIVIAAEVKK